VPHRVYVKNILFYLFAVKRRRRICINFDYGRCSSKEKNMQLDTQRDRSRIGVTLSTKMSLLRIKRWYDNVTITT